jgi:hypothetical protein
VGHGHFAAMFAISRSIGSVIWRPINSYIVMCVVSYRTNKI